MFARAINGSIQALFEAGRAMIEFELCGFEYATNGWNPDKETKRI